MNSNNLDSKYYQTFCTGCGLCHAIYNYDLFVDKKGFPTVSVDTKSNLDELNRLCPSFFYSKDLNQDFWGIINHAYVGYSSDKQIRYKASSGGAITEICIYLIESGLVDGILHTTADPDDETKTISSISYTPEEIISKCGSRYSISVPLCHINDLIDKNKRYAFVGKPCDVMALRRAMDSELYLKYCFPYLISFFCAGEPSVDAQNELINAIGSKKKNIKTIRYRGYGWPGHTTVIENNGNVLEMEYINAWGKYLGRDIRNACRFCIDGTGDAADIVCADFWYLENGKPSFTEHDGRNLIIARTDVGSDIVHNVINNGQLIIEEDFSSKIDKELHFYQPGQFLRKCTIDSMIKAMSVCGKITPSYNRKYTRKIAKRIGLKVKLRYFFGTLKRILNKSIIV